MSLSPSCYFSFTPHHNTIFPSSADFTLTCFLSLFALQLFYLPLLRTSRETTKYYHLHSSPTLSFAHAVGNSNLFSTVKCNETGASPPTHSSALCITGSYGSGTEMLSRCKITSYSSREQHSHKTDPFLCHTPLLSNMDLSCFPPIHLNTKLMRSRCAPMNSTNSTSIVQYPAYRSQRKTHSQAATVGRRTSLY